MAAPEHVRLPPVRLVRRYESPDHVPEPWAPDRVGDLEQRQPQGDLFGWQGPDQGYGLLLAVFLAIILSIFLTLRAYENTTHWIADTMNAVALMTKSTITGLQRSAAHRDYMLTGDETYLDLYDQLDELYEQELAQLIASGNAAQAQRWIAVQEASNQQFSTYTEPGYELRARYEAGEATMDEIIDYVLSRSGTESYQEISDTIGEIEAAELANLAQRVESIERGVTTIRWVLVLGVLIVLGFGLVLGRTIISHITTPIKRVAGAAQDIAAGNLDRRIGLRRGDELGELAGSFDLMASRVQHLIEERDESLREIQQQQDVLRAVMDSVPVGIILVGLDGTVQLTNQPMDDLLNTDASRLIGLDPDAVTALLLTDTTNQPALINEMGAHTPNSDLASVTIYEVPSPVHRIFEVHAAPVIAESGNRLGRIFTVRDVTREREVDRMKTEFVSMVAHELRTPLTSIKGFVDLLRDGDAGELTDEQLEFLTIVATNTDRLVAMINDLLDISRIESGKVELVRTQVDLGQSIRNVATTLRPQIEAKHQRLTLDLPDNLVVSADADRVAQILTNLLSNASKFTPPDHDITIVAEPLPDAVRVDVTDTGIGLSRADQAKLFSRFYRSTNQAARQTEGTGLGLAITRSLVELHGGTISVRSAPGRGSTFSFTLPREAPSPFATE